MSLQTGLQYNQKNPSGAAKPSTFAPNLCKNVCWASTADHPRKLCAPISQWKQLPSMHFCADWEQRYETVAQDSWALAFLCDLRMNIPFVLNYHNQNYPYSNTEISVLFTTEIELGHPSPKTYFKFFKIRPLLGPSPRLGEMTQIVFPISLSLCCCHHFPNTSLS